MRLLPITLVLLFLAPLSAFGKEKVPTRKEIESDLVLEIERNKDMPLLTLDSVRTTGVLRNTSATRTHRVIAPGGGAQMKWVEPYVWYTARVQRPDGTWAPVRERRYMGACGMGDYRWQKNVTDLAPGGKIDFSNRLSSPSFHLDLPSHGRIELRLHYAFRRKGTTSKTPQGDPLGSLGPMKAWPAFELVSKPLVVALKPTYEVLVERKKALKPATAVKLSDLVEVTLVNRSKSDIVVDPKTLRITVEVLPQEAAQHVRRKALPPKTPPKKASVKAGNTLVVVGKNGYSDEAWVFDGKGEVEIQVVVRGFAPSGANPSPHGVRSAWLTLTD